MNKKICFIGDSKVGKTSLINLFITSIFDDNSDKMIREKIIIDPKKLGINYYPHLIELIDCSGYEKDDLPLLIKGANIIVIVYDLLKPSSFSRYLSMLTSPNIYSVIVIGNKFDLVETNYHQKVDLELQKAELEKYQITTKASLKYFYTSCKNYVNISDVFYEIINSLVNPQSILFSPDDDIQAAKESENNYNKDYIKALKRIFRVFDSNRRGVLTKNEFMKIHKSIFDKELESDHFEALKELIKSINYNSIKNFNDSEIDLQGFIAINQAAVSIQEAQITWSILRKQGYNDSLVFDDTYLYIQNKLENLDFNDFIVEISEHALELLSNIFHQYSKDRESRNSNGSSQQVKILTETEWVMLFSPCVGEFELNFHTTLAKFKLKKNEITLEDWFFIWSCYTRMNYKEAYMTFLYIGFEISFNDFARKIERSKIDLLKPLTQKTIYISVVGEKAEDFNSLQNLFNGDNSEVLIDIKLNSNEKSNGESERHYASFQGITYIFDFNLVGDLDFPFADPLSKFRKYDILLFIDEVKLAKFFSFSNFRFKYLILYKYKKESYYKENELNEDEIFFNDVLFTKLKLFRNKPSLFLKDDDLKEVQRDRQKSNFFRLIKFTTYLTIVTGLLGFGYYYIIRKYFPNFYISFQDSSTNRAQGSTQNRSNQYVKMIFKNYQSHFRATKIQKAR